VRPFDDADEDGTAALYKPNGKAESLPSGTATQAPGPQATQLVPDEDETPSGEPHMDPSGTLADVRL
jgi:hypothetical protein